MSVKEFNEREIAHRIGDPYYEDRLESNRELFEDLMSDLYDEEYAARMQQQNPAAYREQLKNFNDEHSC